MNTVLVLNQDYTPLTVCSVQRAFMLMFLKKADLISDIKDKRLRSISNSFPFPSVIKVKYYISIPYKGVVMSRHNIFKRDGGRCQYCGTNKELTIDHVVPRSKGGKSTWTNLVTACKKCNSRKSDFTLEKVGMKLSKAPIKPSYITFLRMNNGAYRDDWTPYLNPKKASA
ncbi:HNH endonuclease [Ekhidna sp. To15]|uniref:HNH endonuclease n=1 Tax=Ekhidna sp. To15 TaxID=3395267 RepID=UPI003F523304